jgi:hypothetical protein
MVTDPLPQYSNYCFLWIRSRLWTWAYLLTKRQSFLIHRRYSTMWNATINDALNSMPYHPLSHIPSIGSTRAGRISLVLPRVVLDTYRTEPSIISLESSLSDSSFHKPRLHHGSIKAYQSFWQQGHVKAMLTLMRRRGHCWKSWIAAMPTARMPTTVWIVREGFPGPCLVWTCKGYNLSVVQMDLQPRQLNWGWLEIFRRIERCFAGIPGVFTLLNPNFSMWMIRWSIPGGGKLVGDRPASCSLMLLWSVLVAHIMFQSTSSSVEIYFHSQALRWHGPTPKG